MSSPTAATLSPPAARGPSAPNGGAPRPNGSADPAANGFPKLLSQMMGAAKAPADEAAVLHPTSEGQIVADAGNSLPGAETVGELELDPEMVAIQSQDGQSEPANVLPAGVPGTAATTIGGESKAGVTGLTASIRASEIPAQALQHAPQSVQDPEASAASGRTLAESGQGRSEGPGPHSLQSVQSKSATPEASAAAERSLGESGQGRSDGPRYQSALGFSAAQPSVESASARASADALALPARVGTPAWAPSFADRVAWLAKDNVQLAELKLNPPELGRIDVRITIQGNGANVVFGAEQAAARDAIEHAVPRLREAFAAQGLSLGDVDVSGQGFADRREAAGEGVADANDERPGTRLEDQEVLRSGHLPRAMHDGLVDDYV